MQHVRILIFIVLLLGFGQSFAQNKIGVHVESRGVVSSNSHLLPLFQYSNQWGIVSPFEQKQGLLLAGAEYKLLETRIFQLGMGVSGVVKNKFDDSFLHEAYLNGSLFNVIDFNVGKQAYTPVSIDDDLTSGGFMLNSNARPLPGLMLSINDYWPVSFLRDWVEIKGGIVQGVMNDDRTGSVKSTSADDLLVHEKWFYIRGGRLNVKPYVGLFHGALFGGTRPNGDKIPVDFWSTFFAKGSNKIGGGEATNAAGAHDGFWDMGIYYASSFADFQVYVQKPFADGSGLKIAKRKNHDYKIGVYANFRNVKRISKISVELIKTDHQSGAGIPDPVRPSTGGIFFIDEIDDPDSFMLNEFGIETEGYDQGDLKRYLESNQNYGHKYGGRDDYNNNGTYYNGWTYHHMPMGTPLYHTYWQAQAYAPDWTPNNGVVFVNNRIKGIHLGLEGDVTESLSYLIKATYTLNKGTYGERFLYRYSWVEDPDYLYEEGKTQLYSYLGLIYRNKKWKDFSIQGTLSFDTGELYNAVGCSLGIKYTPTFNL